MGVHFMFAKSKYITTLQSYINNNTTTSSSIQF